MTKAPDRIWASSNRRGKWAGCGGWAVARNPDDQAAGFPDEEYVRADLAQAAEPQKTEQEGSDMKDETENAASNFYGEGGPWSGPQEAKTNYMRGSMPAPASVDTSALKSIGKYSFRFTDDGAIVETNPDYEPPAQVSGDVSAERAALVAVIEGASRRTYHHDDIDAIADALIAQGWRRGGDDYKRGQEDMRERCAEKTAVLLLGISRPIAKATVAAIRALPIKENDE